jgi:hypothetical protein
MGLEAEFNLLYGYTKLALCSYTKIFHSEPSNGNQSVLVTAPRKLNGASQNSEPFESHWSLAPMLNCEDWFWTFQ